MARHSRNNHFGFKAKQNPQRIFSWLYEKPAKEAPEMHFQAIKDANAEARQLANTELIIHELLKEYNL